MPLYYATTTDILRRLPPYLREQLLDDDHDGHEEPGLAELILEEAESEVNACLSARYVVPLTDANLATARRLTLGVFAYKAHERLNSVDDRILRSYELVRQELRDIGTGKLERVEHQERPSATASVTSSPRVFTLDKLRGL